MSFQLNNVTYKQILDIPDLEIPEGAVSCIFGESGAGKTTLLRLLNHLISADHGQVLYQGQDVMALEPRELRRRVVMLPQNPVVFDGTIRDNLLIGLHFAGKSAKSDKELGDVLRAVHLNKELDNAASKLSGGEQQRMALARVLLLEPDVLLLDEPSSALDEDTEKLVIDKVVEYVKQGNKTLIMITHSRKVVKLYAEYVVELVEGKVKEVREVTPQWQTEE